MSHIYRRVAPGQAVLLQTQLGKAGDATPKGWTAEQDVMGQARHRQLGCVGSAADLADASRTWTDHPARAITAATVSPLGPEPTMTTSTGSPTTCDQLLNRRRSPRRR